jgi:hypothetical protein
VAKAFLHPSQWVSVFIDVAEAGARAVVMTTEDRPVLWEQCRVVQDDRFRLPFYGVFRRNLLIEEDV